ncbi:STAS domain-containing protein [Roseovarius sp. SCSIO 43702]|uniref:STAS domain-containing protein n=1 Tax=Roseovarius sp. SCSIO 43702 TaxID=2823043 RepID=UPI001C732B76|nr:STAS domain-containing protein [Roseovarius sp. SCSIO 43702]QYX56473.1 STAS domain-containing protein [Roseovarius sp. SCSIO 43702]
MKLSSSPANGATLITVNADRIDASAAIQFRDSLREATATGTGDVILDLSQVTFVDSSGLGAIVGAMKQLDPVRRMHLAGLTPDVDKVFRLTRMDTVFTIHPNAAHAIRRAAG